MGHRDARSVEKYAKLGIAAIRAGLERLYKRGRGHGREALATPVASYAHTRFEGRSPRCDYMIGA